MIALFDTGAAGIRRYSKQIENANNVTITTAQKQMMAMKSQLERMREYWDALKRHIVDTFAPAVTNAISTVIAYMNKWTEAVDANRDTVKQFVKDVVGMMVTFGKITVGLAGFMLVTRVLGGLVMILQAIISPLGLVIVTVVTLQTLWRSGFAEMREIGLSVFGDLKKGAEDFFLFMLNGISKTMDYVINQMSRASAYQNIPKISKAMVARLETVRLTGDPMVSGLFIALQKQLSVEGKTREQALTDMMLQNREMYEAIRRVVWGSEKGMSDLEFMNRLSGAILSTQGVSPESVAGNILKPSEITLKTIAGAGKNMASMFVDTLMQDIRPFLDKLKGIIPGNVGTAWGDFAAMLKAIQSGAGAPLVLGRFQRMMALGAPFGGATPSTTGFINPYHSGAAWNSFRSTGNVTKSFYDQFYGGGKDAGWGRSPAGFTMNPANFSFTKSMWLRFLDVTKNVAGEFNVAWDAAIKDVMRQFKSLQDVMITAMMSVRDEMALAFDSLMRRGSSLVSFLDSVFQSILNSFRRMVAEMLANTMFNAMFGTKEGRTTVGYNQGADIMSIIRGAGQIFNLGWLTRAGTKGWATETVDEGLSEAAGSMGGVEKRVPGISLNVTNNGAPVTLKAVGKPTFDGKQIVVNYVMEEAVTNPRFREIPLGRFTGTDDITTPASIPNALA